MTIDEHAPIENPFVGPKPLQASDRLFARDVELRNLSDLLVAERVVLLYSPSGAGKTSLIHAGLLKRLRQDEEFRVLPVMRVNLAQAAWRSGGGPGNKYVRSALDYLESGLPEDKRMPVADLETIRFKDYLDRRPRMADDGPVGSDYEVLVFDQFEEIITLDPIDHDQKAEFFRQIGEALRDRNRWALFVMREDHVAEIDDFSHLLPTSLATRFRLNLLSREQASEAIKGPAEASHRPFGGEVVERLVADLATVTVQDGNDVRVAEGEHVEPVQLQVVCRRLWNRHVEQEIGVADLGGSSAVNEALEHFYADTIATVVRETGVRERSLRDWVEKELIIGGTLRGQVIRTPGQTCGLPNATIDALTRGHLLRAERRGGREWIEITHDRLLLPIRENNARWRKANLTLFQQQAALWAAHERAEGMLLSGAELDQAQAWAEANPTDLEDDERDYLAACQAARERQRQIEEKNRQIAEQNQRLEESNREIAEQSTRARRYARFWFASSCVMLVLGVVTWALFARTLVLETEAQHVQEVTQIRQLLATARDLPQVQYGKTLTLALHANDLLQTALKDNPADADLHREELTTRFTMIAGLLVAPPVTRTFAGHGASVRRVAWSPDGKVIASASFDKSIVLWNAATGAEIARLKGHDDGVYCVEFSPDGSLLASADAAGRIRLWQVTPAGAQPIGPESMNGADGHRGKVTSLAFGFDGRHLVSGGWDNQVIVWDVSAPASPRMLASSRLRQKQGERHRSVVYAVAFVAPNLVAAGDWSGEVRLWAWSSQQTADGKVAPLDSTRRLLFADEGLPGAVHGIAYDPMQDRLAANGWVRIDKKSNEMRSRVAVWEAVSTEPRLVDDPGGGRRSAFPGFGVDFSRDGSMLASTGGIARTLTLQDLARSGRATTLRFQERVFSAAFSPRDPALLAIGGARNVMLLDTRQTGSLLTRGLGLPLPVTAMPLESKWQHVAMSPDARLVVAAAGRQLFVWRGAGDPLRSFEHRATIDSGTDALAALAINRNGTLIAAAAQGGGRVRLWSADGMPQGDLDRDEWPLPGEENPPHYRLAFSPANDHLLAVAYRRNLSLYRVDDPRQPVLVGTNRTGHAAPVRAIAFHPAGTQLASADASANILLWGVSEQEGLAPIAGALRLPGEAAATLAYSPDGRLLAAGSFDSDISVFDMLRERETIVLADHEIAISNLAFGGGSNDPLMLSMDREGRGYLWDARGGHFRRLGRSFSAPSSTELPMALSAGGDLVVTGGLRPRIWDLRRDSLVRLACQVRSDDFNEVERKAYGITGLRNPCSVP